MHGIFRESQPTQANVPIYQATVSMPCLFDMIFLREMRRPFADCVSRSHGNQALRDCSPLLSATFSFTRRATTRRQSEMMNEEWRVVDILKQEKSLRSAIFLRVHQWEFPRLPKGKQHRRTNIFKSTSTKQSFHVFSKENYICCVNKVIKDLHQERPTRGGCIILECHASIVESYEM